MAKSSKNASVDRFFSSARQWQPEMEKLRSILLECGLTEELKWGKPCYAFEASNVVILQGFKDYCALLFFKGMLLKDTDGMLVKTGENTRVGRQIRFTDSKEITSKKTILKAYIYQAIEVEKAGLKIEKDAEELNLVEEFKTALNKSAALKKAFYQLTPGRQRAYNIYISQAKQSATRVSRIEKCKPQILDGKGLND